MRKILSKNKIFLLTYLCISAFVICAAFELKSMGFVLKIAALIFFVFFLFINTTLQLFEK